MTLVDLMTTLGAAALVLTLGVPSFRGLQADMQRTQVRYALMGSFSLARAEAIRRGVPVTVCSSGDGVTCSEDSMSDWSPGWIVASHTGGGPNIFERVQFNNAAFSLIPEGSVAAGVTYNVSGLPHTHGAFLYRDDAGAYRLQLSPIGRMEFIPSDVPSS